MLYGSDLLIRLALSLLDQYGSVSTAVADSFRLVYSIIAVPLLPLHPLVLLAHSLFLHFCLPCHSFFLFCDQLPIANVEMRDTSLINVCVVGGNAVSAFLSWRLQATNACDVTLVWKSGFDAVHQYGISFKYVLDLALPKHRWQTTN